MLREKKQDILTFYCSCMSTQTLYSLCSCSICKFPSDYKIKSLNCSHILWLANKKGTWSTANSNAAIQWLMVQLKKHAMKKMGGAVVNAIASQPEGSWCGVCMFSLGLYYTLILKCVIVCLLLLALWQTCDLLRVSPAPHPMTALISSWISSKETA